MEETKMEKISLPEEILVEILRRLPVKSVLRCRCVQKSWNNLIQTSFFISMHLSHQEFVYPRNEGVLFRCDFSSDHHRILSSKTVSEEGEMHASFQVLKYLPGMPKNPFFYGISHGLICLSDFNLDYNSKIYLWNPSIHKFITLPDPPQCDHSCQVKIGFGFVPNIDDYRVVRIRSNFILNNNNNDNDQSDGGGGRRRTRRRSWIVDIYSLKTNSWKTTSPTNISCIFIERFVGFVILDGIAFAFWAGSRFRRGKGNVSVVFDIEMERLSTLLRDSPTYESITTAFLDQIPEKGINVVDEDIWKDKVGYIWKQYCFGLKNKLLILMKHPGTGCISHDLETGERNMNSTNDSWDRWYMYAFVDSFVHTLLLLDHGAD